jgi:hypothetical protein
MVAALDSDVDSRRGVRGKEAVMLASGRNHILIFVLLFFIIPTDAHYF